MRDLKHKVADKALSLKESPEEAASTRSRCVSSQQRRSMRARLPSTSANWWPLQCKRQLQGCFNFWHAPHSYGYVSSEASDESQEGQHVVSVEESKATTTAERFWTRLCKDPDRDRSCLVLMHANAVQDCTHGSLQRRTGSRSSQLWNIGGPGRAQI